MAVVGMYIVLTILVLVIFGLAWGAGTVLVTMLRGPWRQATQDQAHWTERARLGFAPGFAVVWLAVLLPLVLAFLGDVGMGMLVPDVSSTQSSFGLFAVAGMIGVLSARYRWLREFWGPRVTLRSWLPGVGLVLLISVPQFLVMFLALLFLPDAFGWSAMAVMGVAVLVLGFISCGGVLFTWRLLGIASPAPAPVTEMVLRLAEQMQLPRKVEVVQLEWPQVNAVAWVLENTVGFSRAMLGVMSMDELRAIAAHEVAHLLEPKSAKAVRILHLFAYLPLAPLMRYGGTVGLMLGYLLIVVIFTAHKRFVRRLEMRADRMEREALTDSGIYMQSMVKLHESNLTPAVTPGTQTHPHLYDRLLAAGIQPEFARPAAPDRTKPMLAAWGTVVATGLAFFFLLVIAGCNQKLYRDSQAAPAATKATPNQ
jgi:Zn-dependent protease with chaperone function